MHHGTNRPVMVRIVHGTNSPGGYEQSMVRTVQEGTNSPRYEQSKVRKVQVPLIITVNFFYNKTLIRTVAEWSDRWMLKLNTSKCKSITIGNPKFKIPGTYTYTEHGTHTLEELTIEKDLCAY